MSENKDSAESANSVQPTSHAILLGCTAFLFFGGVVLMILSAQNNFPQWVLIMIGIFAFIGLGMFGWWLREHFRVGLGGGEVVVSVAFAAVSMMSYVVHRTAETSFLSSDTLNVTAQVLAAAFVFVRGMANIKDGMKGESQTFKDIFSKLSLQR